MSGDDYAVVAILLGVIVAVLLFRHRKRAFTVCQEPTHSTAVARYQVRSMKRKWSHGKWIRVCPSCWERTRDESDEG